jgi:hypothetical protein
MNLLKKIFYHRYIIYHLRWQISAFVMMIPMICLEKLGLPLWENLMIGQFIGACVFYVIDKKIFSIKE